MTGPSDFTIPRDPKPFILGGKAYLAPPLLSATKLQKLGRLHERFQDAANTGATLADRLGPMIETLAEMFRLLIPGQDGQRISARLTVGLTEISDAEEDALDPIDLTREAVPAIYWLLEQYGLRPTRPSSPSSNGSTDGSEDITNESISSTDGASLAAFST